MIATTTTGLTIDDTGLTATGTTPIYNSTGNTKVNKLIKNLAPRTATATGAITANDEIVVVNSASATTQTLDNTSTFGYEEIYVKNIGAGIVTIATTSAQTIDAGTTTTLSQYQSVTLRRYLTNWIII